MVGMRSWYLLPLAKANLFVTGGTALFILLTRSVHAAYFGLGTVVCSLTAKLIKHLLRHPRPPGSRQPTTYGMPSTHTSAIAFQSLYLTLSSLTLSFSPLLPLLRALHIPSSADPPSWVRWAVVGVYVPYAVGVAWCRVSLGHHTPLQVLGGAVVGLACAWGWFGLWPAVRDTVGVRVVELGRGWVVL